MKRSLCRALLVATSAIAIAFAPVESFAQGGEVPKPAVDLTPGTATYKVRLEAAGQVASAQLTRTTKSQNRTWVVTETSTIAGQTETDETTFEKKTLILRKRLFRAGDGVADLNFAGHKVTGTITNGRDQQPIDRDLGVAIFADGSGGQDVLAALPLAKGYSVEFRNFNVSSLDVKSLKLWVADTETVTVPAGTFDTWKALITSLDGGSDTYALWVEKRTHRVVKMAISVPNMHDALITAELIK